MKLDSSNSPIYLPDREQTSVLRLGLEHCPAEQWIAPVSDLQVFYRNKVELASSRGDQSYAECAGSAETQREFHAYLLQHLLENPQLGYSRSDSELLHEQQEIAWELNEARLWNASLWVPEDICLLEKKGDQYTMTAASVCAPSNWILPEKIGQTIDFIHDPVPAYQSVLSSRVNRFLDGMRSGRVMLRYNWSIQPGNALFWRDDLDPAADELASNTAGPYWRIERQTFVRLPVSGAIVFGIRIFLHSFNSLRSLGDFDSTITRLLSRLPDAEKRYKGLDD